MFISIPVIVTTIFVMLILALLAFRRRGGDMLEDQRREAGANAPPPPPRRPARTPPPAPHARANPGSANPANVLNDPDIRAALNAGHKIKAIKLVRQRTGLGLKESKDLVERG